MIFVRDGEPYLCDFDRLLSHIQHPTLINVRSKEVSAASSVDASSSILSQQRSASRPLTMVANGTVSNTDRLFSKLTSPVPTPNNSKVTLETLFASASTPALSAPTSNLIGPLLAVTNKCP